MLTSLLLIAQAYAQCYCPCPKPTPAPTPPSSSATYCPRASDFTADSSVTLFDGGWTIRNGGGAASRASFNFLNGGLEFTMDVSRTNRGVNTNMYSISPIFRGSEYTKRGGPYCDAQREGNQYCMEIDWVENNGPCAGRATLHTIPGPGNGCTKWGCSVDYPYDNVDKTSIRMKFTFDGTGRMTTYMNGIRYEPSSIKPTPKESDWKTLRDEYTAKGGVIMSTQWVGWVPNTQKCGGNGQLQGSVFTIRDLRITGKVVQGPEPRRCS